MIRILTSLALLAIAGSAELGQAQPPDASAAILATDTGLIAAVHRITERSPLWREALGKVAARGRQVLLLTADQVVVRDAAGSASADAFDATVLAEAAPLPDDDGRVETVMVVVNLALLEERHRSLDVSRAAFEADLDRIVIHEVYGHAVPYLLAGSVSGRCADPAAGEPAVEACSIRRENAVRAEAGLGLRTSYGIEGLALARNGSGDRRP